VIPRQRPSNGALRILASCCSLPFPPPFVSVPYSTHYPSYFVSPTRSLHLPFIIPPAALLCVDPIPWPCQPLFLSNVTPGGWELSSSLPGGGADVTICAARGARPLPRKMRKTGSERGKHQNCWYQSNRALQAVSAANVPCNLVALPKTHSGPCAESTRCCRLGRHVIRVESAAVRGTE
jgi:hypothetical protein